MMPKTAHKIIAAGLVSSLALTACSKTPDQPQTETKAQQQQPASTSTTQAKDTWEQKQPDQAPTPEKVNASNEEAQKATHAILVEYPDQLTKALEKRPDLAKFISFTAAGYLPEGVRNSENNNKLKDGIPAELANDNAKLHEMAELLKSLPAFAYVDTEGASEHDIVAAGFLLNHLTAEWMINIAARKADEKEQPQSEVKNYHIIVDQVQNPKMVMDKDLSGKDLVVMVADGPVFAQARELAKQQWLTALQRMGNNRDSAEFSWLGSLAPQIMLNFVHDPQSNKLLWNYDFAKDLGKVVGNEFGEYYLTAAKVMNREIIKQLLKTGTPEAQNDPFDKDAVNALLKVKTTSEQKPTK